MTYEELLKDQTFKEFAEKMNEFIEESKPIIITEEYNLDQHMYYQVILNRFKIDDQGLLLEINDGSLINRIGTGRGWEWDIKREDTPGTVSFSLIRNGNAIFGFDF